MCGGDFMRRESIPPVGEGVDRQVQGEGGDEEDVQAVEEEGELGPALVRGPRDELRLDDGGDEILPPRSAPHWCASRKWRCVLWRRPYRGSSSAVHIAAVLVWFCGHDTIQV